MFVVNQSVLWNTLQGTQAVVVDKSYDCRCRLQVPPKAGEAMIVRIFLLIILACAVGGKSNFKAMQLESVRAISNERKNDKNIIKVGGRYINRVYGYTVIIPDSFRAYAARPPLPNHGFFIQLHESRVTVDGSYNTLFWKSSEESIQFWIDGIEKEIGRKVTIVKREKTYLAGLEAEQVIIRYEENGRKRMAEYLVAFRSEKDGNQIVYTINSDAIENEFLFINQIQATLRQSWRILKI